MISRFLHLIDAQRRASEAAAFCGLLDALVGVKKFDNSPFICTICCTGGDEMEAITYTAARKNLAKTMEKVCRDRVPMIITRKSSESIVIMSLEDFESLEETAYLLRSPKNARRLIESIVQLENGKGNEKELIE
jgi:antitoxin YefM